MFLHSVTSTEDEGSGHRHVQDKTFVYKCGVALLICSKSPVRLRLAREYATILYCTLIKSVSLKANERKKLCISIIITLADHTDMAVIQYYFSGGPQDIHYV